MPWSNVRFEDQDDEPDKKLISVDWTDDTEFKDGPLVVTILADPRDGADILRQCERQLARSRKQLQAILNEEAILAILNKEPAA